MTSWTYELLDHTADMGFRVRSASADGILEAAARALADIITPVGGIGDDEIATIRVDETEPALALHGLLDEILFQFETTGRLLVFVDRVERDETGVTVTVRGAALDAERNPIDRVIKAVTLHGLRFEREEEAGEGWVAEVILDL